MVDNNPETTVWRVTKATTSEDGVMHWQATTSKFSRDQQGDFVKRAFYEEAIKRFQRGASPAPFFSVAHYPAERTCQCGREYKSLEEFTCECGRERLIAGITTHIYIDGSQPKAKGVFFPTKLGKSVYDSCRQDIEKKVPDDERVRVSMGFYPDPDGVARPAPGQRDFEKGWIEHFAATRVPVVPETNLEVKALSIKTRYDDAAAIIPKALADELEAITAHRKSDIESDLVIKAEAADKKKDTRTPLDKQADAAVTDISKMQIEEDKEQETDAKVALNKSVDDVILGEALESLDSVQKALQAPGGNKAEILARAANLVQAIRDYAHTISEQADQPISSQTPVQVPGMVQTPIMSPPVPGVPFQQQMMTPPGQLPYNQPGQIMQQGPILDMTGNLMTQMPIVTPPMIQQPMLATPTLQQGMMVPAGQPGAVPAAAPVVAPVTAVPVGLQPSATAAALDELNLEVPEELQAEETATAEPGTAAEVPAAGADALDEGEEDIDLDSSLKNIDAAISALEADEDAQPPEGEEEAPKEGEEPKPKEAPKEEVKEPEKKEEAKPEEKEKEAPAEEKPEEKPAEEAPVKEEKPAVEEEAPAKEPAPEESPEEPEKEEEPKGKKLTFTKAKTEFTFEDRRRLRRAVKAQYVGPVKDLTEIEDWEPETREVKKTRAVEHKSKKQQKPVATESVTLVEQVNPVGTRVKARIQPNAAVKSAALHPAEAFMQRWSKDVVSVLKSEASRSEKRAAVQKSLQTFADQVMTVVNKTTPVGEEDLSKVVQKAVQEALEAERQQHASQMDELATQIAALQSRANQEVVKSAVDAAIRKPIRKSFAAVAQQTATVQVNEHEGVPVLAGDTSSIRKATAAQAARVGTKQTFLY